MNGVDIEEFVRLCFYISAFAEDRGGEEPISGNV